MKNELPKRILIIHVARVSHQVFARVGSRVLSRLEFQDQNSHNRKVLNLIKNRYLKERICTWQLSKHITNICFESVIVKQLQLVYFIGPKTLKTHLSITFSKKSCASFFQIFTSFCFSNQSFFCIENFLRFFLSDSLITWVRVLKKVWVHF